MLRCRVCGSNAKPAFTHTVLGRYSCAYYQCESCGFLQTEEPYWLEEAYSSAIAVADTGLVQRNLATAKTLSSILCFLFDRSGMYLDVGGGYGLLARLMRDVGFDFYWWDDKCRNLLAQGFEAPAEVTFTAATAFEVLEHVPSPVSFLRESMARADTRTVIFSTQLFEGTPPAPDSWWYYAFDSGQHVSFFQRRTLARIAEQLGLNCYLGGSMHMLTDRTVSPVIYRLLSSSAAKPLSRVPEFLLKSKTMDDHLKMTSAGVIEPPAQSRPHAGSSDGHDVDVGQERD